MNDSVTLRNALQDAYTKMGARAYNMSVQVYDTDQYITVMRNCFAFMFTNVGGTIALVNGMVIFPSATPATAIGDSRTISGHLLDLYKGNIMLSFRAPIVTPAAEIVQLFYI